VDGRSTALFAVMDGHAGSEAAAFCARHIVSGAPLAAGVRRQRGGGGGGCGGML
jgi:hypothetical protein